jgi:hypothetical protein
MKLLAHLFGLTITMGLSFCVMWFGWGLRPVSWGWVIWGSIGAVFVGAVISVLGDDS